MSESPAQIAWEDFERVEIRCGQIVEAFSNEKARKPAYVLRIDFGALGQKTSSAQITENYRPEDLIGKKIIAVVNFPKKKIAGVASEVLVLATVSEETGTLLVEASGRAPNGSRIL